MFIATSTCVVIVANRYVVEQTQIHNISLGGKMRENLNRALEMHKRHLLPFYVNTTFTTICTLICNPNENRKRL